MNNRINPDYSSHRPNKSLGQVFLKNKNIIDRIISACQLKPENTVFEIGPGPGTLTRHFLPFVKEVIAVEKDKTLCHTLGDEFKGKNVKIICSDILKFPFETLPTNLICIGNLPYYISSPIIQKLIENRNHFQKIFITVQLEFANRMTAKIGTKDYSSLTCFVQYYTRCQMLFKISRNAFAPVPKVNSSFMQLNMVPSGSLPVVDELRLFKIIHLAFQQRRKTIANALATTIGKERLIQILDLLKIKPNLRAENLRLEDFISICNCLKD